MFCCLKQLCHQLLRQTDSFIFKAHLYFCLTAFCLIDENLRIVLFGKIAIHCKPLHKTTDSIPCLPSLVTLFLPNRPRAPAQAFYKSGLFMNEVKNVTVAPNLLFIPLLQKRFPQNKGIDPGLINIYAFNAV